MLLIKIFWYILLGLCCIGGYFVVCKFIGIIEDMFNAFVLWILDEKLQYDEFEKSIKELKK